MQYTDLIVHVLVLELQMYLQCKAARQLGVSISWSQMSKECLACCSQDVGVELVEALAKVQEVPDANLMSTFHTLAAQAWHEKPPYMHVQDTRADHHSLDGQDSTACKLKSEASMMPCVPLYSISTHAQQQP